MSTKPKHNRFGDLLPDDPVPEPADASYVYPDGSYKWDTNLTLGFDPTEATYHITLKKGDKFFRYGKKQGAYAAPIGTLYKELALPYKIRSCEYNEYEVVENDTVHVTVRVEKGKVGKQKFWPSEPGGGIQYHLEDEFGKEKSVLRYLEEKALDEKEVAQWSPILSQDTSHL